jgi:hypothetical protein
MRRTLATKLHPKNFTEMSPRMAAIVAYIVGESWTEPNIKWLSITTDGCIVSERHYLGQGYDLDKNIDALIQVADLSKEEEAYFRGLMADKIDDWRKRV